MKNQLLVDIDSERDPAVMIKKQQDAPQPHDREEFARIVKQDMACLCEAVVTLIHLAEQEGIRPSAESLRLCLEHLKQGFAEPGYVGKHGFQLPNV